ncbi:unnamed protein product [Zymoseptoria tritici ST99CH_3D1]|uniref:Uncharacterized protein n=1 Tax=Zymoseptoria tritici (strain ST99CH_3D7) TaxID=1276538 RepID=A0A1X7RLH6_ZYMT9|nr:unnamed protein product [Zymoseptoria tritici ST99CH_3D7]SMR49299.1 unnamed protein product [Zymoseptoria tritici ST99CH_3D1]
MRLTSVGTVFALLIGSSYADTYHCLTADKDFPQGRVYDTIDGLGWSICPPDKAPNGCCINDNVNDPPNGPGLTSPLFYICRPGKACVGDNSECATHDDGTADCTCSLEGSCE